MARRGHECRCCQPSCDKCDKAPTLLAAALSYPAGSGEIIAADTGWTQVTTTCSVPAAQNRVDRIRITNGGQDYTTPPTVTFSGGGGTQTSGVVTIESEVTGFQLTNPGSGYQTAPIVTVNPPAGGGQIEQATGAAIVRGSVVAVLLTNGGSGYTSAPTVTIHGEDGVSSGATATATISGGSVASIQVTAGGSGYSPAPSVTISGGGGSGAAAVGRISGSVESVEVLIPGRYRNTRTNGAGSSSPDWPTVTIGGNATAVPQFRGRVVSATAQNSGYSSPPAVSFSGGGGSGAQGVAELAWQRTHTKTAPVTNCVASMTFGQCLDATATTFPPSVVNPVTPQFFCLTNHAERLSWSLTAWTSALLDIAFQAEQTRFAGEAIWIQKTETWQVPAFANLNLDPAGPVYSVRDDRQTTYALRFFSRVPPQVVYRLSFPQQNAADNAQLVPVFTQYVDQKGDSFWYLESLTISNAGTNLNIPPGITTVSLFADGNSRHVVSNCQFTDSRGSVVFKPPKVDRFTVQPQLDIQTVPSQIEGWRVVSTVSVSSGGQTTQPDGQVEFWVELERGHFDEDAVNGLRLRGTVVSGQMTAVTVVASSRISPPATLTSLTLPADPTFDSVNRVTTGESLFRTTHAHTEPVVTARLIEEPEEGGTEATFGVTLEEATDQNGEQFWSVSEVEVDAQGSGYTPSGQLTLLFEVPAPGMEMFPAYATVVKDRDQPTVEANPVAGGAGAVLAVQLQEQATVNGDPFWEVSGVTVTNGGTDYENGTVVTFAAAAGQTVETQAAAQIAVDGNGTITAVTVLEPGRYYEIADRVRRVRVDIGGKYFVRTISETETNLPDVECIGAVTPERGWKLRREEVRYFDVPDFGYPLAVGESLSTFYQHQSGNSPSTFPVVTRTRRCDLPQMFLEFQ